ncbi:hypothetical protein [Pseudophaeobacter flagellatus]|uniref:hypothetical protein n=1 Tax=Pseudophaeobacter flagellatus TaxID=2899119 RepID=UPI001E39BD93|nr:hypothetical protein [Pseudophaeobacter flagellatus]
MNWERVNSWTSTLYTVLYALDVAKNNGFSNRENLGETIISCGNWFEPKCSFSSPLLDEDFGRAKVTFRRDPAKNFEPIAQNVVKMLLQDLVVIFDEMMSEALLELSTKAGEYPQSKVEKLYTYVDDRFEWSRDACLEMIAVRNVLCHAGGQWNERSINIVKDFVSPPPEFGDRLIIGTPMLFRYRKAMRTFLNEVKKSFGQ